MTKQATNSEKNTENSLKAKDIATIIKVAKSAGLTHFRYGTLEFSFKNEEKLHENGELSSKNDGFYQKNTEAGPGSASDGGIPIKQVEPEDFLNELMISDPLAYEEEIERRMALEESNGR